MENQQLIESKTANTDNQEQKIEVQVEKFPVAKPKFSKEAWDSGEGGGEGEG